MSFFGANRDAWNALSPDLQDVIRTGVAELEAGIWAATERDKLRGPGCYRGELGCGPEKPGGVTVVPASEADEADEALRRRLVTENVLPNWFQRCWGECEEVWANTIAPLTSIQGAQH